MAPQCPAQLKGHKLQLKIDSTPPGAQIYIVDKACGLQGLTPSTIKIPKGAYKIILEQQGFKSVEQAVQVDKSQGFVFTLERKIAPAVLDIRSAGDDSANGGSISVDGQAMGSVPNRVQAAPGSHLIEISRPGYVTYRDTIQIAEGETRTVVVTLPAAIKPGSILVTADVAGADVFVDGQRKDSAPAVIDGLLEGAHTVEVRKDGMNPWKQVVTVIAGQQVKVAATVTPPKPESGSLKVLSSTPGAEVFIDGDDKGPVGVEIKDVRPGTHIVEVRAAGFDARRSEVAVAANELKVTQLDLVASVAQKQVGGLRVISPVPGAEVFLDGSSVGTAPVDRSDISTGKHFVVVHRDGFADFKTEIEIENGKTFQVSANLSASGSLKVLANVAGADVLLDGAMSGKTPASIDGVSVGQHIVEIKMANYLDGRQVVTVSGGQQQVVQIDLQPMQTGPTVLDLQRAQRGQSSYGATIVERGKFNVDLGVGGMSYFFMARVISGVYHQGSFGLDMGVELRTSIYETDIGLRPRAQLFRADPLAVGADLFIGGGGGPEKRNSFTFEAGIPVTMLAGDYVRLTFRPYLQLTSDRLCPSVDQLQSDDAQSGMPLMMNGMVVQGMGVPGTGSLYKGEQAVCSQYDKARDATGGYQLPAQGTTLNPGSTTYQFGQMDPRERFSTTRLMLQGVIEVAASENLNFWILVEGAPAQDQRQAFTSKFSSAYTDNDFPFYVRLGSTFKF